MVATYYKMPDGKIATQSGVPVTMTQAEFEDCCCGGPAPCDVCQEDQTSTLTLTVSDPGECDAGCADAAVVGITWASVGTVGNFCFWRWDDNLFEHNYQVVQISYYPGTGVWLATAEAGSGPGSISAWARSPITGVTCNADGQLTGSFSLDGLDLSGEGNYDCSGCTLNITIVDV